MAGQDLILTAVISLTITNTTTPPTPISSQFALNRRDYVNELTVGLRGKHLTIATSENYPLSYTTKINGTLVGGGAAFTFVKLLQAKFGFEYSVVVPESDVMGTEDTGIFGLINTGKADMAASFLPVVREGQQFVQYSRNLDTGEFVVLMRRPKESAQGSGLLAPFTLSVWLLILVSLIAVGPIIYLLIILRTWLCPIDDKNKGFPLPSCVWFVYGALLKQGSTLSPVSDSARLIFATWWIFITILTAFYTANLTAFLTLSQFTLPIQKPDDILKYRWITRTGNAVEHAALDESETITRVQEGKFVNDSNKDILENYVKKSDYLFLQEKPTVDYLMYDDYLEKSRKGIPEADRCTYVITSWSVISRARAFAYRKDFPWSDIFDQTLQLLVEAGIIKYRLQEGLPNAEICPLNLNSKERQLRNSDLWTTYEVIFVGFSISAFVFIAEVCVRYKKLLCTSKLLTPKLKDEHFKDNVGFNKGHYFTPPPPSYQTLFGQKDAQKRIVNGRDYWVFKSNDGDTRLVPMRTPSALLFQYTN